jgi:hypothetical protein
MVIARSTVQHIIISDLATTDIKARVDTAPLLTMFPNVSMTRTSKLTCPTRGWKLLCQWKNGSSDWVDLRHLKDSNPIEVAEYAVAKRIQEGPAFKWWVPETLRTRNRIIG